MTTYIELNAPSAWYLAFTSELQHLRSGGLFCDVVIEVDEDGEQEPLAAHSSVLAAASPTLSSYMQQQGLVLRFDDVTADTWNNLLMFMYTGKLLLPVSSTIPLHKAAIKFGMDALVELLEEHHERVRIEENMMEDTETPGLLENLKQEPEGPRLLPCYQCKALCPNTKALRRHLESHVQDGGGSSQAGNRQRIKGHEESAREGFASCSWCKMAVRKVYIETHQSLHCPLRALPAEPPPSYDCVLCQEECLNVGELLRHYRNEHDPEEVENRVMQAHDLMSSGEDEEENEEENDEEYEDKSEIISLKIVKEKQENLKVVEEKQENLKVVEEKQDSLKIVEEKLERKDNHQIESSSNKMDSVSMLQCCNRTFRTLDSFNKHKDVQHKSSDSEIPAEKDRDKDSNEDHECPRCSKVFTLKRTLQRHIKTIHNDEKTHICDHCNEAFRYGHLLKKHLSELHDEESPKGNEVNQCSDCGVAIKGPLVNHMWVVHGVDIGRKRKLLQCDVCGLRANSEVNLRSHMNKHTGERCFKCPTCDASFKQSSSLRKHVKLHSGAREFKCKVCGREFARQTYLQQHLRIHTGEKPFKCEFCDKSFAQKTSLNVHFKSQHNIVKPRTNGPTRLRRVQPVVEKETRQKEDTENYEAMIRTELDAAMEAPTVGEISSEREIAAAEILCNMDTDVLNAAYFSKSLEAGPQNTVVDSNQVDVAYRNVSHNIQVFSSHVKGPLQVDNVIPDSIVASASVLPTDKTQVNIPSYQNTKSTQDLHVGAVQGLNTKPMALSYTMPSLLPTQSSIIQTDKHQTIKSQPSLILNFDPGVTSIVDIPFLSSQSLLQSQTHMTMPMVTYAVSNPVQASNTVIPSRGSVMGASVGVMNPVQSLPSFATPQTITMQSSEAKIINPYTNQSLLSVPNQMQRSETNQLSSLPLSSQDFLNQSALSQNTSAYQLLSNLSESIPVEGSEMQTDGAVNP